MLSWRLRQKGPPMRCYVSTKLHGVTYRKTGVNRHENLPRTCQCSVIRYGEVLDRLRDGRLIYGDAVIRHTETPKMEEMCSSNITI